MRLRKLYDSFLVYAAARAISGGFRFFITQIQLRIIFTGYSLYNEYNLRRWRFVCKSLSDCGPAYVKNLICHFTFDTRRPGLPLSIRQI